MKSKKNLWLAVAAVTAVGLVTGVIVADHLLHRPVASAEAMWTENFKSPNALARSVDAIVLAQAVDVAPGRIALSDKGEGGLPFQLVDFEVLHAVRGAAVGDRITVERAGGVGPAGPVAITFDGGEFEGGQAYLLFLKQQPGTGYYYQVNHQGRYQVRDDHLMAVAPDDPVATRLHGVTLERGLDLVRSALGATPPGRTFEK